MLVISFECRTNTQLLDFRGLSVHISTNEYESEVSVVW